MKLSIRQMGEVVMRGQYNEAKGMALYHFQHYEKQRTAPFSTATIIGAIIKANAIDEFHRSDAEFQHDAVIVLGHRRAATKPLI